MNTPKDASDTAIVRLFDELETDASSIFDAEPSDDIAAERAAVESSRELDERPALTVEEELAETLKKLDQTTSESVNTQLADMERYFAFNGLKLSADMRRYVKLCLGCCYSDGYVAGKS